MWKDVNIEHIICKLFQYFPLLLHIIHYLHIIFNSPIVSEICSNINYIYREEQGKKEEQFRPVILWFCATPLWTKSIHIFNLFRVNLFAVNLGVIFVPTKNHHFTWGNTSYLESWLFLQTTFQVNQKFDSMGSNHHQQHKIYTFSICFEDLQIKASWRKFRRPDYL